MKRLGKKLLDKIFNFTFYLVILIIGNNLIIGQF